ncbi:MAG: hypothetical protein COA33_004080 [Fluviicola sp.]|nr:hypothetical protein [Fluviicola sp.]
MKIIKPNGLFFVLLFFFVNPCYAEGQSGMAEFYMTLYCLTFGFYTFTIGGLILLLRKILGLKNSKTVRWIAFGIGFSLSIVFYLIDDFYFLPIFWGD